MEEKFMRRFNSFRNSLNSLSEARERDMNDSFVLSGTSAKFSITFDLAWKVMKDILVGYYLITDFVAGSPREVLKKAFEARLISDDVWMEMLKVRNQLIHDYDGIIVKNCCQTIIHTYLDQFYEFQFTVETLLKKIEVGEKNMENTDVIIRLARPEEGERLAEIEAACFPPAEAADRDTVLKRLAAFPENFVVAELDGAVVGFINGGNTDEQYLPDAMYHDLSLHKPDGAYQTVFGLNVMPEHRKCGIAAKLVKGYIEVAKQHNRKGIILTCKDHMIHYYEKFGFVCHGVADSTHGGAKWNDMRLIFAE